MASAAKANTMKRKLVPNPPTWIPMVVNLVLIFIAGILYVYNAVDMPTVKEINSFATLPVPGVPPT